MGCVGGHSDCCSITSTADQSAARQMAEGEHEFLTLLFFDGEVFFSHYSGSLAIRMSTRSRNSTARNSRAATPNALPISRSSKTKASAQDDHAPDWVEPISVHSDNETLLLLRANTEYAVVTQFLALFGADMNIHDYSTAVRLIEPSAVLRRSLLTLMST